MTVDPASLHPLGTYGLDWNERFAFIAGFTSGGCAYGVPWAEATWLLDEPEFAERVLEAQAEEAALPEPSPETYYAPSNQALGRDPDPDRASMVDEDIPF